MVRIWNRIHKWIETGDLIPLLIAVSVAHYVDVLRARDFVLVAAFIGVLVDLGQYRLLKASLKKGGWWWIPTGIMTVIALGYHYAFYTLAGAGVGEALLLAAPIPFLIIALAALSVRENWQARFNEPQTIAEPEPNEQRTNTEPKTAQANRGERRTRIISELERNPSISFAELHRVVGGSKSFVSETRTAWLSKHNGIGFKTNAG